MFAKQKSVTLTACLRDRDALAALSLQASRAVRGAGSCDRLTVDTRQQTVL